MLDRAPATLIGAFQEFGRSSPVLVGIVSLLCCTTDSKARRLVLAFAEFSDVRAPDELFRLYEDGSLWSDKQ